VALADRHLMDVAREDQLGARVDQAAEHPASVAHRLLPRTPGCAEQVMVQNDDAERVRPGFGELLGCVRKLGGPNLSRLMDPRPYRVQPDDVEAL
jgi:hypothetical protein